MAFISLFCRTTGKSISARPTTFYFAKSNILATSSLHNPSLHNLDPPIPRFDPMVRFQPQPAKMKKTRFDPMVRFQPQPFVNASQLLLGRPTIEMKQYTHDRVDFGFVILARIFKLGYKPDAIIFSTVIQGLFKGNRIVEAMELFKMLVTKKLCNETTYETVIDGLCKSGNPYKALELIRLLERDEDGSHKPNTVMYNTVIDSLCKDEKVKDTVELLSQMTAASSTPPNIFTYTSVIQVLCKFGFHEFGIIGIWEEVKRLLTEMINANIYPDVVILRMIVDTFRELGVVVERFLTIMVKMFHSPNNNVLIYNALMELHCLKCEIDAAVQILPVMRDAGYEPTISSYNIILKAYWKCLMIDDAFSFFFKEIIGKGLEPNVDTYNTMVQGLFDRFYYNDAINWIKYMRTQGVGQDAFSNGIWIKYIRGFGQSYSLLCKMISSGAPLDISACNCVLDDLFREGKPDAAWDLFNKINHWLDLKADDETFNIMIHGLCQKGLMEDAKEVLKKMKECGFVMNYMMYNFLLYGFNKNGDGDGAELLQEMSGGMFRPCPIAAQKGYSYDDDRYEEEIKENDSRYDYMYDEIEMYRNYNSYHSEPLSV